MGRPRNPTYYIDRETWLKYLQGPSPQLRSLIESQQLVTSVIELVGVIDVLMQADEDPDRVVKFIESRAWIVPMTLDVMEAMIADQSGSGNRSRSVDAFKRIIIRNERAVDHAEAMRDCPTASFGV